MIIPIEDREEILFYTDNRKAASEIRQLLLDNFNRLWVLVYHDMNNNTYGVEALNSHCMKLDEEIQTKVDDFVNEWMEKNNYQDLDCLSGLDDSSDKN